MCDTTWNSTRHLDVNFFFDTLLQSFYEYQNLGIIMICGDFNSRCGDSDDFIFDVDEIHIQLISKVTLMGTNFYSFWLIAICVC